MLKCKVCKEPMADIRSLRNHILQDVDKYIARGGNTGDPIIDGHAELFQESMQIVDTEEA